jgi:formamidopyrimidine-DNA glycosylase
VPELPEVETVVRDLRARLTGRTIASVRAGRKRLRRPWLRRWSVELSGASITAVERRGKWIIVALSGERYLLCHLGMTGQMVVRPADKPLPPHTHLVFSLDGGHEELRFRDIRRFGSAELIASAEDLDARFRKFKLGPEPFAVSGEQFGRSLASTRRCLKAVLLDQRVVAGVGNIYADEALFEARLHPARPGHRLTPSEIDRLRRAVQTVLERAIERRGSSIRDYVDGNGAGGNYQNEFRVYGRTGQPCRRCRTPLVVTRLAGRSSHYCPKCQKLAEPRNTRTTRKNRQKYPKVEYERIVL